MADNLVRFETPPRNSQQTPPPQPPHSPPLNGQLLPPIPYKDSNSIHADYIYYSEGTVEHQPGLPFQSATRHNRPRASTTSNSPLSPASSNDTVHHFLAPKPTNNCKNLFFPPTPYSQLKIFIFVFTINRHRSISRIRQANAQSNELGTKPHLSLSHCPDS
ncbi:hypothetical protein N7530_012688 [Penicillium desertorum]|uniref:Uncharacterized protein n=1 Tax=Penicillium desertorum TaxID=1303715 RepID=A0A9W9WD72_9EURO|nr:hypothetical protein N7530_012688 [Penicillium desertorum]